ncbi:MAG: LysR family transcriptional regulator [Paludibacterium sp.]|uniref:LysR family transcriptional regulator n=1 Tax=Paludibacterium sp. TaxID=1917523 RepID=UPI0025F4A87A|nr:LysR family transcriptional regulator [Paludibacterium sp.]MBV8046691.1 LysR family transcriptional regulator [Paludibacterium sp.]MBV8647304.1 LysR family transcriptional regulator [Paludibacterium sp.]
MAGNYSNWFIRARLKTRQLLLLVALDEERNIHRTAEALLMTQPAASKLLKELEDTLGVALFERLPRGMKPTWYGEIMIRHARMVLSSLNQAQDEISALKSGRMGQVRLGAITDPGAQLVPRTIARVKQQYPLLDIHVAVDTSDMLLPRLLAGKLDIVIGRLLQQHDKTNLIYERIAEEPIVIACRPEHPLLGVPRLSLRDVAGMGWILTPVGSVLRHRVDMAFRQGNLEPPMNVVETASQLMTTALLESTDMLAVIAQRLAGHYSRYGMLKILPLELPSNMDEFGFITRRDHHLSPGADIVLTALKDVASEIYPAARAD